MNQILIIDDNKGTLEIVSEILISAGYKVLTASSGKEGIRRFKNAMFNLILTDINMPEMDGNLVAESIRKSPNFNNTPIVAITGSSREVRNELFDHIIRKPFSTKTLLSAVAAFIKRTRKIQN